MHNFHCRLYDQEEEWVITLMNATDLKKKAPQGRNPFLIAMNSKALYYTLSESCRTSEWSSQLHWFDWSFTISRVLNTEEVSFSNGQKNAQNPITGEAQEEAKGNIKIFKDEFLIAQNAHICPKGTTSKKDTPLLIFKSFKL